MNVYFFFLQDYASISKEANIVTGFTGAIQRLIINGYAVEDIREGDTISYTY